MSEKDKLKQQYQAEQQGYSRPEAPPHHMKKSNRNRILMVEKHGLSKDMIINHTQINCINNNSSSSTASARPTQ